jgi:hypothetical protein
VKEDVIDPSILLIEKDLKTIGDQLDYLRELAEKNVVQSSLHYKRSPDGLFFNVFDYTISKIGFFNKLAFIYNSDRLKNENRHLADLAKFVSRSHDEDLSTVRGETLKEAVERAIKIYESGDTIEALYNQ